MAIVVAVSTVVALRLASSLVEQPWSLGLGAVPPEVTRVDVGGREWLMGVRLGDPYVPWADGGIEVITNGGVEVGIPVAYPEQSPVEALIATVLVVVALVSRRLAPGVGRPALVAAAAVAMRDLIGVIPMPAALAVMMVPATSLVPVGWTHGRRVGTVVAVASGVLAVGLAVTAILSPERPGWAELWTLSWDIPLVAAVAIASGHGLVLLLRARRASRPGRSVPELFLDSTTLGRRALRVTAEEERDRAAQAIHRDILPRVATSIAMLRTGDPEQSARILESLAADLRHGLDETQLTVLRVGGFERRVADGHIDAGREGHPLHPRARGAGRTASMGCRGRHVANRPGGAQQRGDACIGSAH